MVERIVPSSFSEQPALPDSNTPFPPASHSTPFHTLPELNFDFPVADFAKGKTGRDNIISAVGRLDNEGQEIVWGAVGIELTRLDGNSKQSMLSVREKIQVIRAAEREGSYVVARQYSLSPNVVVDAWRDGDVVLTYLYQPDRERAISYLNSKRARKRYAQLEKLHEESDKIASILKDNKVARHLKEVPHVGSLLTTFRDFSTIEPLLNARTLNCERQFGIDRNKFVAAGNRSVRHFLFSADRHHDDLGALARRLLFAHWMATGKPWLSSQNADALISQTVSRVINGEMLKGSERTTELKYFFTTLVRKEFLTDRMNNLPISPVFVLEDGTTPERFEEVDVAGAYRHYWKLGYTTESLTTLVKLYLSRRTPFALTTFFGDGGQYSLKSVGQWLASGFRFVENVLLKNEKGPILEGNLMIDKSLVVAALKDRILQLGAEGVI